MTEEPLNGFTGFNRKNNLFQYSRAYDDAQKQGRAPLDIDAIDKIEQTDRRWAWVEIDLNAIRHNVSEARRHMRRGCKLCAVVKADAYGHGATRVARTALNAGADLLAVATVNEGVALRKDDIGADILLLSEPPIGSVPMLLAYRITPVVYTAEFALAYAEEADRHGLQAPYHLAVNTGMNRIGIRPENVIEFLSQVNFHRALDLRGTLTHFATADCPENLDFSIQVNRFLETIEAMRTAGVDPGIVHAANSAALYRYPKVQFDMCRLGIAMYGIHPCPETHGIADLVPAMSVHARITDCKTVPMSEGVSYGLTYRSPGSVKICTVPLGYADGLPRVLSGALNFILDGQYCRQVGNICMDQCMFEVDLRTYGTRRRVDPHIGDLVTVIGRQGDAVCTVTELAYQAKTIEHELCIAFSRRLPRIYV